MRGCRDEHPSNGEEFLMLAKSDFGLQHSAPICETRGSAEHQAQDAGVATPVQTADVS